MAKSRRKAREAALRALYGIEIGHMRLDAALEQLNSEDLPDELKEFAKELLNGVKKNQRALDDVLSRALTDWRLDRIAAVDRNVMRIATFEMYHCPTIPPAVSIDEAIEIGRKFSTAESGKFINGVLGHVLKDSPKANWTPSDEVEHEEPEATEQEAETETEQLDLNSPETKRLAKIGGWKLRSEGEEH